MLRTKWRLHKHNHRHVFDTFFVFDETSHRYVVEMENYSRQTPLEITRRFRRDLLSINQFYSLNNS